MTTFKRMILLALLALTGWAAVITSVAVVMAGRTPGVIDWAIKCAIGVGYLLTVSFAAFTALERAYWRWVGIVGLAAAGLMMVALPPYVWWETRFLMGTLSPAEALRHLRIYGLMETGLLTAGWLSVSAFAMTPRMKRVGMIAQWTTVVYLTISYVTMLQVVWNAGHAGERGQALEEAVVTLMIPAGACLMGVFILQKFFAIRLYDPLRAVSGMVHVRCPRCGLEQELAEGVSRCGSCRLRFRIEVEEPACPNCGFNLHLLTRPICPECGLHLDLAEVGKLGEAESAKAGEKRGEGIGGGVIGQEVVREDE